MSLYPIMVPAYQCPRTIPGAAMDNRHCDCRLCIVAAIALCVCQAEGGCCSVLCPCACLKCHTHRTPDAEYEDEGVVLGGAMVLALTCGHMTDKVIRLGMCPACNGRAYRQREMGDCACGCGMKVVGRPGQVVHPNHASFACMLHSNFAEMCGGCKIKRLAHGHLRCFVCMRREEYQRLVKRQKLRAMSVCLLCNLNRQMRLQHCGQYGWSDTEKGDTLRGNSC